jgi:D-tyrosyl-tRNA(Tyr) deacylase
VAEKLAQKITVRIFRDDQDHMNRSVLDVSGSVLVVSQFDISGRNKGQLAGVLACGTA